MRGHVATHAAERREQRENAAHERLVAGHETTASELAWAFERLARSPAVLSRLREELEGAEDDSYLTATVQETLRRRPVLPNAAPRLVKRPVEIGGWTYPPGACVVAATYLIHHDPRSTPIPTRSAPSAFSVGLPGPTRGSRSGAVADAASVRAAPPWR